MKKELLNFLKSDSLWKQIIGTVIATGIIWLFAVVIGVFKGLDYKSSIQWTLDILTMKISFLWLFLIIIGFIIILRRNNLLLERKFRNHSYSKTEMITKLNCKADLSRFERFEDVYNYRRLKKHPWHDQYVNDGVTSFLNIIKAGLLKNDLYKIENGLEGLASELKEKEWLHSSKKNEIVKEIKNCFPDSYNHHKAELEKILETIRVV